MNDDAEVAVILIEPADTDLFVFVEFVLVERLTPNVDIGEVQGNRDRPRMAHRANNPASRKSFVALDADLSDLDLWSFINVEDELHGVRCRDSLESRPHYGELAPMLGKQLLDHGFGALDFRRIELTFDGQPDFLVLERVENVRLADGLVSLVLDAANNR